VTVVCLGRISYLRRVAHSIMRKASQTLSVTDLQNQMHGCGGQDFQNVYLFNVHLVDDIFLFMGFKRAEYAEKMLN
jgi:hypothetical protein